MSDRPHAFMMHLPDDAPDFLLRALELARIDPRSQGVMYFGFEFLPPTRRARLLSDLIDASGGRAALILGAPSHLDRDAVKTREVECDTVENAVEAPTIAELKFLFGDADDTQ